MTVLTDKEETGSDGNTGLNSSYLKYFVEDLARLEGYEGRDVLSNSKCLSADVNAAFDPTWSTPFEKNNSSFINEGVCVTKFTGARGKGGTSDASAEYVSFVKNLLESNGVLWQSLARLTQAAAEPLLCILQTSMLTLSTLVCLFFPCILLTRLSAR